ncbi:DoxX family protein [Paractinoplanes rishiriensis]|uniref:DoxX family protein n=1 Tax=Paractinoplanes rishiriensis TaxID=1050105 RepID=UPI001EF293EF|nr:DoxX family protein [Actinoplanes rishiriensis]
MVIIAAVVANVYAAWADFARGPLAVDNAIRVGVPTALLPVLGVLKSAGAAGLLLGLLGVPYLGVAAGIGLVLFFLGAIVIHLRAREHDFIRTTIGYLLLMVAALAAAVTLDLRPPG